MSTRRAAVLARKRLEYSNWVRTYYTDVTDEQRTEDELRTLRQIRVDVPRTAPNEAFFHKPRVQECLTRILYVRAIRNPASGYVQGLNALVTPFLAVFLSELFIAEKDKAGKGAATTSGSSGAANVGTADASPKSGEDDDRIGGGAADGAGDGEEGHAGRDESGVNRPVGSGREHQASLLDMEDWDIDSADERDIFNAEVRPNAASPQ